MASMPLAPASRESLAAAIDCAQRYGSPDVRPVHLLEGIVDQKDEAVLQILAKHSITPEELRTAITELTGGSFGEGAAEPAMSRQLTRVLTAGAEYAVSIGHFSSAALALARSVTVMRRVVTAP